MTRPVALEYWGILRMRAAACWYFCTGIGGATDGAAVSLVSIPVTRLSAANTSASAGWS